MLVSAITPEPDGPATSFTIRTAKAIMRTMLAAISVLVASVLCLPPFAAAQRTVKTFDQLNTRIKTGNTVRLTDTEGGEIQGKLAELRDASITVNSGAATTFEAQRVRLIQTNVLPFSF
jgi:hypothetical protein